jgi:predicted nucleic acid-binding Zn ribbon protein
MSYSDDDDDETIPCPHCRRPVYEDAERCPHCENYLSQEDAPRRHPLWIVVGAILVLAVVLLWIFGKG